MDGMLRLGVSVSAGLLGGCAAGQSLEFPVVEASFSIPIATFAGGSSSCTALASPQALGSGRVVDMRGAISSTRPSAGDPGAQPPLTTLLLLVDAAQPAEPHLARLVSLRESVGAAGRLLVAVAAEHDLGPFPEPSKAEAHSRRQYVTYRRGGTWRGEWFEVESPNPPSIVVVSATDTWGEVVGAVARLPPASRPASLRRGTLLEALGTPGGVPRVAPGPRGGSGSPG